MAETQTYSHEEIQRYLQHKMSQQEMHEFEKALMDDPFLADALEGFSAGDPTVSAKHLDAIERALTGEEQKAKVIPLVVQKTAWWKVAAIILVVISAGAVTWAVLNNKSLPGKNKEQIVVATSKKALPEKDSIGPIDKQVARIEVLPNKQLLPDRHRTSPIIRQDANEPLALQMQKLAIKEQNQLEDRREQIAPSMASSAPAAGTQNDEAATAQHMKLPAATATNEFKGKVVDKSGEPLPFASIKANNSSIGTISDGNGNFSLRAADSILKVNINSTGYTAATAEIKSNKADNRIALKEDPQSMAEVVVTRMAKKKRSSGSNLQADSLAAAEPVGGWRNFRQYMNEQLDSLKAVDDVQDLNEDIVLEFSIDKKGQPTNIKTPPETDKMIADKAIEILTHGPRWKNKKKDKKVKVIIAF